MADALATLLVQEGAVTLEGLARAQALQREQGGSLDTALLELGLVGERRLVAALARASGLPTAPEAALAEPDPRSRRVFPGKVAERHGLAPYRLEGKELHLLATWPVDVAALDEISFMLSLHLVPHVAAEWRVWELRRRVYEVPLPERFAALAARLAQAPAEPEGPAPDLAGAEDGGEAAGAEPGQAAVTPPPILEAEAEPQPVPELDAGIAPPLEPLPVPQPSPEPAPEPLDQAGVQELVSPAEPELEPLPHEQPAAPGDPLARALAEAVELAEAAVGDAPLPATRPAMVEERTRPRARWSLAEARHALAAAATRDGAVSALLRYALDFFEHAALLATSRGEVSGHDALGADPEARERARTVSLPCGDTGIVRAVVQTGGPYLGPPGPDAVVEALVAGLGRPLPRTMLLYPVQIRDRVVCLLYADNGEAPVSPQRVGDLLLLASEAGAALLRILAAQKAAPAPAAAQPPAPPPAPEEPPELSWEALAPAPEAAAETDLLAVPLEPAQAEPPAAPAAERPTLLFARLPSFSDAELVPVLDGPPAPASAEEPEPLPGLAPLAAAPPPAGEAQPSDDPLPETLSLEPPPAGELAPVPIPVAASVPDGDVGPTLPPPGEADAGWAELAAPEAPAGDAALDQEPHDAFSPPPTFDAEQAVRQLEATRRGSAERSRLLAQLVLHGPEAAAVLTRALPGHVNARAPGGEEALPLAERSAVLEALCALDIVATPWLVEVLADPDARRRRYAALLLGQVGDPAAFLALADRVFDPDPAVGSAALGALGAVRGHPDFRPVLERLRRALHGEPPRPAFAARALVELGDGGAVGPLIGLLEGAPGTASAAAEALEALTARRLGRDPAAWSAWWQAHRGRQRTEWLFEALGDDDREVRIAAAEALRAVGPSPVRFFADAPEAERLRAAGEWREWFESHGLEA